MAEGSTLLMSEGPVDDAEVLRGRIQESSSEDAAWEPVLEELLSMFRFTLAS